MVTASVQISWARTGGRYRPYGPMLLVCRFPGQRGLAGEPADDAVASRQQHRPYRLCHREVMTRRWRRSPPAGSESRRSALVALSANSSRTHPLDALRRMAGQ